MYRNEANKTSGASFIFQEDLKTTSKIQAFKTKTNLDVPDDHIKALLDRKDLLDGISSSKFFPRNKLNETSIFSNIPLGNEWARYYIASLEYQKVTHFSVSFKTSEKLPFIWAFRTLLFPFEKLTPVNLTFYQDLESTNSTVNLDPKDLPVFSEYLLLVQKQQNDSLPNDDAEVKFIPVRLAHSFFADSRVFPDNKVLVLKEISEGQYEYPLIDFLYFSAVTITTLGYGDILPATSHVRCLVMIETLLGVILIGAFISMLFWDPSFAPQKPNHQQN